MTTQQPPSDPSPVPIGDEPVGALRNQPDNSAGRRSWKPVVIAVVAIVIAGAVAGTLLFNQEESQPKERGAAPVRGPACPYLQQAADAYNSGDDAAFEGAIAQAKDVAEKALQTSGQVFGKPERLALELKLGAHPDVPALLAEASSACSRLGQWNAPGN